MGEAYEMLKCMCEGLKANQGRAGDNLRYLYSSYGQKCQKEVVDEIAWNNALQTGIPLSERAVAQFVSRVEGEFEKRADGTYYNGERVFNATLRFVGITKKYSIDERNIRAYYNVEVNLKGEVSSHEVSAGKIRSPEWFIGIAGVSYDRSIKGNPYGKLIEQEIDEFKGKVTYVYPRTGWKKCAGGFDYLLPDGFVYGDRNAEVRVPFSWAVNCKKRNLAVAVEIMLDKVFFVTEKEKAGMMLFLYTQLSYLASLFKEAKLPIKYIFALIGERGSMKTSLAQAIALGCWEDPMKELQVPFISTSAGIEAIIDYGADRVVLVDDYKPTLDRNQKVLLQTNLELVTRIFGDETGKKRNMDFFDPEVEKKSYSARGGCVITGELLDVVVESLVARMLICTVDTASVDVDCLTWLQKNKNIMACFQTQFLHYVVKNQTWILSFIERRTEEVRAAYQRQFTNARYSEYLAQLLCVIELLESFLREQYPGTDKNFFVVARSVVFEWIQENSKRLRTQSVYAQVGDALLWMISSGEVMVENLAQPACSKNAKIYISSDYVYFERSSVFELFQRYCKKTGVQIPVSSKQELEAIMLSKGLIIKEHSEGRETIGVKRPMKGVYDGRRFIKVSTDVLNKVAEDRDE